jgi:putative DNA methylase
MQPEGEHTAANLLARLGSMGEVVKDLPYRLYGVCERKGWADEGLAYNSLVISWPELPLLGVHDDVTGPGQEEMNLISGIPLC